MVTSTVAGRDAGDALLESVLLLELDDQAKALLVKVTAVEFGCALLRFLDAAADSLSTTDGIAFRLNQPNEVVENSLQAFLEFGLVRQVNLDDLIFWGMVADPKVRWIVRNLIAWQNRWLVRLVRVEQLIDGRTTPENIRIQ